MRRTIGFGFIACLSLVISVTAYRQNKAMIEAEKELAEIPVVESVLDERTVAEQAMDDIVARYQEEPEIESIEKEGNKMSAPYSFLPLDDELQIYMEERCTDLEINFFLAASLMESESSFNPEAVGDSGRSVGLFQVNKCWWTYMAEHGIDVHEPRGNIDAGLRVLRGLMDDYPDDVSAVIQCYKCGQTRGEELMREGIYLSCIEDIVNQAIEWQTKED